MLWLKVKDTKSESNSQLPLVAVILDDVVAQGQRYKIWKQFTTARRWCCNARGCGSRSKIQNLKAIHNPPQSHASSRLRCGSRSKIQNLKAIHNYSHGVPFTVAVVAQGQRYKIWKQFTTSVGSLWVCVSLWLKVKDTKSESNSQLPYVLPCIFWCCGSRSKIQNLKAIHNGLVYRMPASVVVAQGQRYKIWKQFTTGKPRQG